MKTLVSCAYNMDNCCVELKFTDGSMIAIDTIAVENEVADNMYQRSELCVAYNKSTRYRRQNSPVSEREFLKIGKGHVEAK